MTSRLLLLSSLAIASCGELPATDDPRMQSELVEEGSCSGWLLQCEDRAVSQCPSGCEFDLGCQSPVRDRCAAYTVARDCELDYRCWLASTTCLPRDLCSSYHNESDCVDRGAFDPCLWARVCSGQIDGSCSDFEDPVTCNSNLGCTWTSD